MHAPAHPVDRFVIKPYVTLCGRSLYPPMYLSAGHLLETVAYEHGEQGSGWGDWCKSCRKVAEEAQGHEGGR
jgi:hypothetical protein